MTAAPQRRFRRKREQQGGQAVLEFTLIAPVAFMLLFGIISACWLFYQASSLHDGASAGSRAAAIETSLVTKSGANYCESQTPVSIEQAIASAAPYLPVNMTQLCGTSSNGQSSGVTQLTQTTNASKVNITVTCGGNCSAPTTLLVSLSFNAKGVAIPLKLSYTMTASSQVPIVVP